MTHAAEPRFDVGTVAGKTGVSPHTLRYWERAGLVTAPARDPAGRRAYSDTDVARVLFVARLRATGMPVREIRAYVDLLAADGTIPARLALLTAHRDALQRRLTESHEHLRAINHKIDSYQELM